MFEHLYSEPLYCAATLDLVTGAYTLCGPVFYIFSYWSFLQVFEEFKRTCQALSEKLGNNWFFINDR